MNAPYQFGLADILLVVFSLAIGFILGNWKGYLDGWNACYARWFGDKDAQTEEAKHAG